jgi:hypothetical protein
MRFYCLIVIEGENSVCGCINITSETSLTVAFFSERIEGCIENIVLSVSNEKKKRTDV